MAVIDLNSDLGESFGVWSMGDDAKMLEIVSSANIACGFHAGDPTGILSTLKAAAERGVAVGAHVSYPDRAGFGRRAMDVTHADLMADVIYQIGALKGLAAAAGTKVTYVKPHGALYNTIAFDPVQGRAVIEAIAAIDPDLVLLTLAGAPLIAQVRNAGLKVVTEAFADRAYTGEGRLLDRRDSRAVLSDPRRITERMVRLARTGEIETIDGDVIALDAQSICVHGDSPGAVAIAKAVRAALESEGVSIGAFAG